MFLRLTRISRLIVFIFLAFRVAPAETVHFKHVVVIFQENRSVDNLFGSNPKFEPGVDIATAGLNSDGQVIPLTPMALNDCYDLDHSHNAFVSMYDGGKMDGADRIRAAGPKGCVVPQNPQFRYVDNSKGIVQPYFDLAKEYAFANRMFQTNQGPSFPAHQFILSGTSAPTSTSPLFAAENTKHPGAAGCIAPGTQTVALIDPQGNEDSNPPIYPCLEHATLTDLLDAAQVSWRYYAPHVGSTWTAPNAIDHMCGPKKQNGELVCTAVPWNNVIIPETTVLTDIQQCQLAEVSWVIPNGLSSDHAQFNDGSGPSWVASVVNTIGSNAPCPGTGEVYWRDTAILITWDDWGGWYDHVPPYRIGQPNGWGTGYTYGFRVPLLVVSAYTAAGSVDNDDHDFGSILKFIETNFGPPEHPLGPIGPKIYADVYADDLAKFFTLGSPRPFQPIPTEFGADHFLEHLAPRVDPDDDDDLE